MGLLERCCLVAAFATVGCSTTAEVGRFDETSEREGGGGSEGGGGAPAAPLGDLPAISQARIGLGAASTCAIDGAGAVVCWGDNGGGQLGIGSETLDGSTEPMHVTGLGTGVQAIFGGTAAHCAVEMSGKAVCWGDSFFGQLSDFPATHYVVLEPFEAPGLAGLASMAIGTYFHCALDVEGGVKCYGMNGAGQLGNGTLDDSYVPADVLGIDGPCRSLSASQSGFFACAATSAGAAKCWGTDDYGQLGDGGKTDALQAVQVSGLESGVTAIATGREHACAAVGAGVKCWGSNAWGQLGTGDFTDSAVPVDVEGLPAPLVTLTAGVTHTCGLTAHGAVYCWGSDVGDQAFKATLVIASGVVEVVAGGLHTCALLADGVLRCWGSDYYGELGHFGGQGAAL